MAFTELRVSGLVSAGAQNAGYCGSDGSRCGANGGPLYAVVGNGSTTGMTVAGGTETLVTDLSGSPWVGCAAGDWIVWDAGAGGAKEWRRITSINAAVATVDRACTAGAGKSVNVNGYWALLSQAATKLNSLAAANWPPAVATLPPRLSVDYQTGTAYTETAQIKFTSTWTALIPLRIEGCGSNPGDLDWSEATTRAVITSNQGPAFWLNGAYQSARNIQVTTTAAYWALYLDTANCALLNCKGIAPTTGDYGAISTGNAVLLLRCHGECTSSSGTGAAITVGTLATVKDCTFKGGAAAGTRCILVTGASASISNTHAYGGGVGIQIAAATATVCGSTVADNASHGIYISHATPGDVLILANNLIAHNAGHGITGPAGGPWHIRQDFNAFYDNNGAVAPADVDTDTIVDTSANTLTLVVEPFVETNATNRKTNCDYEVARASACVDGALGVPPQGTTYMENRAAVGALQFTMAQGTYPAEEEVEDTVTYGPTGADYEGSLVGGGAGVAHLVGDGGGLVG